VFKLAQIALMIEIICSYKKKQITFNFKNTLFARANIALAIGLH
jgi:hypothetical protein